MMVFRSVSSSQREILGTIRALHCPQGFECDVTYGNGAFYAGEDEPAFKFDIDPQRPDVVEASSCAVPLADATVSSLVFDPPFLTYVRAGRSGNGKMTMARRFGGYWSYSELVDHYKGTIAEASRLLKDDGVFVVKCQDIIHNHAMHATHINVVDWATGSGFKLLDLFVLTASSRLPSPNRAGKQRHARIFHSYFLVFKRTKR